MENNQKLYSKLEIVQKLVSLLKNKETQKLESKNKIKKLEEEIKILKLQKVRNIRGKKNKMIYMIFHNTYNLTLLLILIFFISSSVNKFVLATTMLKTLYIIWIYLGVTAISVVGAFLSSKIENLIKRYFTRNDVSLSRQIEEKQNHIKLEKDKEEILDKEINIIIGNLNNEIHLTEESYQARKNINIDREINAPTPEEKKSNPYTRIKVNKNE